MAFLDTPYKKKSTAITAVILIALLWMIFNFGMKYQDPPEEYGLAINFGDAATGNETPVANTTDRSFQKGMQQEKVAEAPVEKGVEKVLTAPAAKDVPVMESAKEAVKEPAKEVVKPLPPKEVSKPKPSKETLRLYVF